MRAEGLEVLAGRPAPAFSGATENQCFAKVEKLHTEWWREGRTVAGRRYNKVLL